MDERLVEADDGCMARWWRREQPEPEDDLVIDLRERLEPYEQPLNPGWRKALAEADQKRRNRPLRAQPRRAQHLPK